jgi:hypothetical protein
MRESDRSVLLELFRHVSRVTGSVPAAECVMACSEEFFANPGVTHGEFELTLNLLLSDPPDRYTIDSGWPKEALDGVDSSAALWYLLADSTVKAIDSESARIYRKVATTYLRLLKEDDWECVGTTEHDELVVTALSALFASLSHLQAMDPTGFSVVTAPWTSSGSKLGHIIRDYKLTLD